MARVLVIGAGPLPGPEVERLGFPQLRAAQVIEALIEAGHQVHAALLGPCAAPRVALADGWVCGVVEEGPGWLDQLRALRREVRPACVVSAGPYNPGRAAALIVEEEPLWIDVPGDPFAEARARSEHPGEPDHHGPMLAAFAPALARGDAYGCVSGPQRHALLGQLGLAGRLGAAPADHPWAAVVPVAMGFAGLTPRAPRRRPAGELVVALTGGVNTWLDVPTLAEGLLRAMDQAPGLRVVVTGGGLPGHHEAGAAWLEQRASASPHAARFTFCGWLPHAELPRALASAHLGLVMDRPGLEPELGSRTRLLFMAHQGLRLMGTAPGALQRELAGLGLLREVPPADPAALAEALLDELSRPDDGALAAAAFEHLARRYAPQEVYAPLRAWVDRPRRAAPVWRPEAALAARVAALQQELSTVYATPTWRASAALRRLLKKGP